MSTATVHTVSVDGTSLGMHPSGDVYVRALPSDLAVNGILTLGAGGEVFVDTSAGGKLILEDTTDGKSYNITIVNGVLTPVEV